MGINFWRKGHTEIMKNNFLICGAIGWCWEVVYTSLHSLTKKDFDHKLMGNTSLFMFPIYGSAFLIKPVAKVIRHQPFWLRGTVYTGLIYLMEYLSGCFLQKRQVCPWDYSKARLNFKGIIRLDYAPGWFILGLLYEHLLLGSKE